MAATSSFRANGASLRLHTSLLTAGGPDSCVSPRSAEIERLKAVIETKDRCMFNFAKTLRAADEKALAAERRLQEEKHRLMHGDVSAEVSRLYVVPPSAIAHAAPAHKHPLSLHVCNLHALPSLRCASAHRHQELKAEQSKYKELRLVHDEMIRLNRSREEALQGEIRQLLSATTKKRTDEIQHEMWAPLLPPCRIVICVWDVRYEHTDLVLVLAGAKSMH